MPREPRTDDALKLAALRWCGLTAERLAIEIYATHPDRFGDLEKLLIDHIKALQSFAKKKKFLVAESEQECPEGYVLCDDGLCAPTCDVMN